MKRAFQELRASFWMKVQQAADRALNHQRDVSANSQKNTFIEEKIKRENTPASEEDDCDISIGSNPDQSPQILSSSPETGMIFSKSTSVDHQNEEQLKSEEWNKVTLASSSDAPIMISKLQEILKNDVTTYLEIKQQVENCLTQENVEISSFESKKASEQNQFFEEHIPKSADSWISKSAEETKTYPVLFSWYRGGKEVYLTGDFSQWRPMKMAKVDCCEFSLCLYLPEGSYAYNFIVDDAMFYDERMRYVFLIGKRRNKVVVKHEMYEESKVLSAEFVDVGDTSTRMLCRG